MMGRKRGSGGGGERARIDRIDASLLRLLNRRAAIVLALHATKVRRGRPIYDAARTDAILDRLLRLNRGPLREEQVLALFTFLLHHFALGHRPGRPPEPPLFVAEAAPGSDRTRVARILVRHGIGTFRGDGAGLVDARRSRKAVLKGLAAGAKGAILRVSDQEDEEALADLCYRAKLFCLALRPLPGAGGGR